MKKMQEKQIETKRYCRREQRPQLCVNELFNSQTAIDQKTLNKCSTEDGKSKKNVRQLYSNN